MDLLVPVPREGENNRAFACRVLRMNIMTLRLAPGEALNENELCKLLDMSRTPVHEAITALRDEWLVDVFPQRGTRVSRIDPTLVKEGYNARLLLESDLLLDCAGKLGRGQVQQLLECMHRMELLQDKLPEEVDTYIRLDDELHRMIYFFGGRAHTWQTMRGLVSHYDRLRYLDALEGNVDFDRLNGQHREFGDYLLMGLPEGIDPRQKIQEHMASYKGNLLGRILRYPGYFSLDGMDSKAGT
ncbi:MAG: GntR family transcriptional regulator [Gemmiger sp.]